jgi:hypothetical protein
VELAKASMTNLLGAVQLLRMEEVLDKGNKTAALIQQTTLDALLHCQHQHLVYFPS